jgi:replicative DNA helicase
MPKGATTREIELKYLEICETKFKPDLVIIDYIGIMSPNEPGDSDWLALGKIAADLHEFSRLYEIPTITGSQVNRPKEQAGGKIDYSTNRVARSDMITNNANIIVQIACRDDEYIRTDMPIYIVKMRDGEKGSFTLSKDFGRMKVVDMVDESFATPIDVEDDF